MKKVFVDTNVIVDLIADRKPFSKFAIEIFSKAEKKKITLFTSSHSFATTHYLLKKYLEERALREVLYDLLPYISIIAVEESMIKKALKSKIRDFEDALQMMTAYTIQEIDCVVTRNVKDFKDAHVPVLTPDELVADLRRNP